MTYTAEAKGVQLLYEAKAKGSENLLNLAAVIPMRRNKLLLLEKLEPNC